MKVKTFNDLLADLIKDLYSAEGQMAKSLPKMAKKASSQRLKKAFEMHLEETLNQKERLEKVCELLEITPKGKKCQAMEGLIEEAEEMTEDVKDAQVLDAGLILSAQKAEHYEIASYGTACTFAKILGNEKVLKLLGESLEEEKATDIKLTELAENVINPRAIHA